MKFLVWWLGVVVHAVGMMLLWYKGGAAWWLLVGSATLWVLTGALLLAAAALRTLKRMAGVSGLEQLRKGVRSGKAKEEGES